MLLIPAKTPRFLKRLYSKYVWNMSTSSKVMYLTFDDGPTPEITDWTVDVLNTYNAKATFFCIGENVKKYPEVFQNVISQGHAIGNHTQTHLKGWKHNTGVYLDDFIEAEQVINKALEKANLKMPKLFRPPYGQIKSNQGKRILDRGYQIIMWDVLSFDWDNSVKQETALKSVKSKATNGSIIVFHDSHKASKNMQFALPRVLDHFTKKGYSFEKLSF